MLNIDFIRLEYIYIFIIIIQACLMFRYIRNLKKLMFLGGNLMIDQP